MAKKRKYSRSAGKDVESEMRRYKRGTAKSGPGGKGGRVKSRKQRWAEHGRRRRSSVWGDVVYERGAWYGLLRYRTRVPPGQPGDLAAWLSHEECLGPFKRPRNAMVALEQEATVLQNRHGDSVLFGDQLWAEA